MCIRDSSKTCPDPSAFVLPCRDPRGCDLVASGEERMRFARLAGAMLAVLLLGAAAVAETPSKIYRVGLLHVGIPGTCILSPYLQEAFARHGYVVGKNVVFEPYAAEGRLDRLPGMLDELIAHHADLVVTCGYPPAAL